MKITEDDVLGALWRYGYLPPNDDWCMVSQVPLADLSKSIGYGNYRVIEMLAFRRVFDPHEEEFTPFETLAIEVKVSRSDFLRDVRNPDKQRPWRELAHRHAFAVPTGLVRPEEVPDPSGLMEVDFSGVAGFGSSVTWSKEALLSPRDAAWTLPRQTWRRILETLSGYQARRFGWYGTATDHGNADPEMFGRGAGKPRVIAVLQDAGPVSLTNVHALVKCDVIFGQGDAVSRSGTRDEMLRWAYLQEAVEFFTLTPERKLQTMSRADVSSHVRL